MSATVLVTGGTGFIGRGLVPRLATCQGLSVRAAVRAAPGAVAGEVAFVKVPDLSPTTDWSDALRSVDVVIHLAARAHVLRETAIDPAAEFRRINLEATVTLATQAARLGVRRFIFLSSIGVNGERTLPGKAFTPADNPDPQALYAVSKHEAELELVRIAAASRMERVFIRPPLVYGPTVGGNFRAMMQWLARGVPLPLASIRNKRSFIARDNLVDLIVTCIDHPAAADQTFTVADGEDLSTPELLGRLGEALGRRARLLPAPEGLLRLAARLVGKPQLGTRLLDSLQVDSSAARARLGWRPRIRVQEGLERTAEAFLAQAREPAASGS